MILPDIVAITDRRPSVATRGPVRRRAACGDTLRGARSLTRGRAGQPQELDHHRGGPAETAAAAGLAALRVVIFGKTASVDELQGAEAVPAVSD